MTFEHSPNPPQDERTKESEKAPAVDMSPEAVTVRLRRVEQLRRLCLALGKARPVDVMAPTTEGAPATPAKA